MGRFFGSSASVDAIGTITHLTHNQSNQQKQNFIANGHNSRRSSSGNTGPLRQRQRIPSASPSVSSLTTAVSSNFEDHLSTNKKILHWVSEDESLRRSHQRLIGQSQRSNSCSPPLPESKESETALKDSHITSNWAWNPLFNNTTQQTRRSQSPSTRLLSVIGEEQLILTTERSSFRQKTFKGAVEPKINKQEQLNIETTNHQMEHRSNSANMETTKKKDIKEDFQQQNLRKKNYFGSGITNPIAEISSQIRASRYVEIF